MTVIPDLTGKVCEALLKQEYWYQGTKFDEVNVLFLKIKDEAWHKIFFDGGTLFWREVDAPDAWHTTSGDEYHHPQFDVGTELGLNSQTVTSVKLVEAAGLCKIHFQFSNDRLLILRHLYPQDTTELLVTQATGENH